ncbi:MAG TPA: 5-(carboxyamino)imidazole ribonucleotide mutase [Thermoplasmatales archaeon]|nr:5-(carboxyamino)imidazole ribonucleotide mutase [Thermoplasmatales archaeon]
MKVSVVMASKSDEKVGRKAIEILEEFGVDYKVIYASAHRTPEKIKEIAESDSDVFIAIAGLSAALPGSIASYTTKPVIGVPVSGKVNLDAILSIVQMPPGIPVASVGLDRGDNAGLLAVEILALKNERLKEKLEQYRRKMREKYV